MIESEGYFVLRGWAGVKGIDSRRQRKILELSDESGGRTYYVCRDESRPDVAEARQESFENAGFRLLIHKKGLKGEKFRARIFFYEMEGNRIVCSSIVSKKLQIRTNERRNSCLAKFHRT